MKWLPYELHTHTPHSDGRHSLKEMAEEAKKLGLKGIALTDHNTMSGLADRDEVQKETGIAIIRGLEWTTFYGHMVTLGLREYAEWRDLGPADIHKGIERVHRQGGIVGIAHPFRMGSPICTGCHWEYVISDWNDIDYIEVWHSLFPPIRNHNAPTFAMWTDLLNQGYRIPASSGRDWHISKPNDDPAAASFLGIDEELAAVDMEQAAVDAIRKGRVSLSMGPLLLCSVEISGQTYGLGQAVPVSGGDSSGKANVIIELDSNVREGSWTMPRQTLRVELVSNKGVIGECSLSTDETAVSCGIDTEGLFWLRAQLYGTFHECSTMIAFTNPVYFGIVTE